MFRLAVVSRLLLLLSVLVVLTLGDTSTVSSNRPGRPAAVAVDEDDFTLTAEQERLLFEDAIIPFPLLTTAPSTATLPPTATIAATPSIAAAAATAAQEAETDTPAEFAEASQANSRLSSPALAHHLPRAASLSSPAATTAAAASFSIASVSDSASTCVDDFGGVSRLLSTLFSPSAIRSPGLWSLHTSISSLQYDTITRLLRNSKPQDALDLITMGEQLLASASYHSVTETAESAASGGAASAWAGEGPLSTVLAWLQSWALRLERVLHHELVAPLRLPSSASVLLHGAVVLLLPAAVFVALKLAAPVVMNVLTPRTPQRHLRHSPLPNQPASSVAGNVPTSSSSSALSAISPSPIQRPMAASHADSRAVGSRSGRMSSPESFASALWIGVLLLLLTLFTAGYVHHYHTLHIEQLARNRILQSNPPPGCYQTNEPASLVSLLTSVTTYLTRSKRDDACWRYEASLLQSSWPNPLLVLSSYLSTVLLHPLTHMGDAMGAFTSAFLGHHSVVMQGVMLAFLLLFSLGVVALCMLGGKACLLRCCTGWGRTRGRSGMRDARDTRAARRLRQDSVRIEELMDDEDEWEEEDERDRRRLLRGLLKEHRRREQDNQLLMLVDSKRERGRERRYEEEEEEEEEEENVVRGEDEERKEQSLEEDEPALRRGASAARESKLISSTVAELDEKVRVKHQHQQQQQQQAAVKQEIREQQKSESAAFPSSSSSSSPSTNSNSSPTSSQQYTYPIARPSSHQQHREQQQKAMAATDDAKVKDEEVLQWTGNPLNSQ